MTSAKGNGDPGGRITLPFRFDTSPVVRLILRGVLALLLLVIVPGLLYSLLVSHRVVVAVQLGIIGLIAGYFGWLFLRNLSATRGSIGRDEVVLGLSPRAGDAGGRQRHAGHYGGPNVSRRRLRAGTGTGGRDRTAV